MQNKICVQKTLKTAFNPTFFCSGHRIDTEPPFLSSEGAGLVSTSLHSRLYILLLLACLPISGSLRIRHLKETKMALVLKGKRTWRWRTTWYVPSGQQPRWMSHLTGRLCRSTTGWQKCWPHYTQEFSSCTGRRHFVTIDAPPCWNFLGTAGAADDTRSCCLSVCAMASSGAESALKIRKWTFGQPYCSRPFNSANRRTVKSSKE